MAEPPQKPRKIRDLKARLGRTISPNTPPGAGVPPPAGGGAIPPPNVTGPRAPGSIPAPVKGPGFPGRVAPPFQKKQPAPQSADPFAAAPASTAAQEVRLVIDDAPVEDAEVGRKKRGRLFLTVGAGAMVGLIVGIGGGSMRQERLKYNLAVSDGKSIYQAVRTAADAVNKAKRFVDTAHTAAAGNAATKVAPAVDFEAIEALRGLEQPFTAEQFTRQNYNLFAAGTVNSLFSYYNNVNMLWDKFERLANRSLSRREQLTASAAGAANVRQYTGCVPGLVEERFVCSLVFLSPIEDGDGSQLNAQARFGRGRKVPKTVFTAGRGQDLTDDPSQYVMLVHTQRSMGVLGVQANEFGQYAANLNSIKALLDETTELQGRLENQLGEVASLEEIFAF